MKQLLLISFDLIREGEPGISLAAGYLIAYMRSDGLYGRGFQVTHFPFNLHNNRINGKDTVIKSITSRHKLSHFDSIAISCYVWSDYLINPLIKSLRENGFRGKIILGGYQISYVNNLEIDYPDCQVFILGQGEKSLLKAIYLPNQSPNYPVKLDIQPEVSLLPSPYLSNVIPVEKGQLKVRIETKRGCPYSCSFCAHRDLQHSGFYNHADETIFQELMFFKKKSVKKINVIDPLFNIGDQYLRILERCSDIGIDSRISLQTRFEPIRGQEGDRFLELCSGLNVTLEFGLQTIHKRELKVLNRENDLTNTKRVLKELSKRGIVYEVTLLYGIPNQTIRSFGESIRFLRDRGCTNVKAFPLMLLKGTDLCRKKHSWLCEESLEGDLRLPVVVCSTSFSRADWDKMKDMADSLIEIKT